MEKERLQIIYQKTDGNCYICHGKLNFLNNAVLGALIVGGIGLAVGDSVGGLIGSFIVGLIGNECSPKK